MAAQHSRFWRKRRQYTGTQHGPTRRRRPLRVESLESRQMLSLMSFLNELYEPVPANPAPSPTETAPGAATLAELNVSDPSGDAQDGITFADMTDLTARETADALIFELGFARATYFGFYTPPIDNVHGAVLLDLDGDRQTPADERVSDASVTFDLWTLGGLTAFYNDPSGNLHQISASSDGSNIELHVPKTLLPSDLSRLELAAITTSNGVFEGRDRTPDMGYVRFPSGTVHVDNEGLALAPLTWLQDPARDSDQPADLRGIQAEVRGEHLVLRAEYHHSLEANDLADVLNGRISLDLDGDVVSGFESAGSGVHTWPTFGIDAQIRYKLYPRVMSGETEVELVMSNPQTGDVESIGFSSNPHAMTGDVGFHVDGKAVEFAIPLSTLPPVTDQAILLADSFLALGTWDDAPDAAGLKLATGTLEEFLRPAAALRGVEDPAGDSGGQGQNNDDLTGLRFAHYEEGILLEIGYTDLDPMKAGITQIHFDVDQNPATGSQVVNAWNHTVMGSDTSISYQWDVGDGTSSSGGGLTAVQKPAPDGREYRGAETLVGGNFATETYHVTVPYRALGMQPGDGVDVYVTTMSSYLVPVPYDELNSGALSIGGNSRNVAPANYPTAEEILAGETPAEPSEPVASSNDDPPVYDPLRETINALLGIGGTTGNAVSSPSEPQSPFADPLGYDPLEDLLAEVNAFLAGIG